MGKADVSIDSEHLGIDARDVRAGRAQAPAHFGCKRMRRRFDKHLELLFVRVEPRLVVVTTEFAKEGEGFLTEALELRLGLVKRHGFYFFGGSDTVK